MKFHDCYCIEKDLPFFGIEIIEAVFHFLGMKPSQILLIYIFFFLQPQLWQTLIFIYLFNY